MSAVAWILVIGLPAAAVMEVTALVYRRKTRKLDAELERLRNLPG